MIEAKLTDFHAHLAECSPEELKILESENYSVLSSCHSKEELEFCLSLKNQYPQKVFLSYGVLPQNPDLKLLEQLQEFLKISEKEIFAIGECGFDLRKEYRPFLERQKDVFEKQLEIAIFYQKPVVLHCVKALPVLFEYAEKLKKLPLVIFHSYSGSLTEANSFLKKGMNAKFSFGNNFLRGDKNAVQCVKNLPHERICLETDAPYQLPLQKIFDIFELCAKL